MKAFSILIIVTVCPVVLSSCDSSLKDPQIIIDKTIEAAGGEKYLHASIEFDFRGRHYVAQRNGGTYSYQRVFNDSLNTIHDFVTNDGFKREINGEVAMVHDSMATKYTSSVNSVIYFALLPYGLNDDAVNKKLSRTTSFKDHSYYVIEVTFNEDGGGEDHEDVFLYWINQKAFSIDYMAYSFDESDEISFRFRVAYNPRVVNGIRFQDYINYKPVDNSLTMDQAEELFKKGELVELSRIETENVNVD